MGNRGGSSPSTRTFNFTTLEVFIEVLPKNTVSLKFTITPENYQTEFKKQVNSYARQAVIPGFRQGTVPPDLIKAKYGQSLLYDIVNKKVSEELQKTIENNHYDLIARPLLKNSDLKNLKPNETFTFEFQLALFPSFELDFSKISSLDDFNIEVSDKDIEDQIKYIQRTQGKLQEVLEIESLDKLYKIQGKFIEIDDSGVEVTNGYQTELIIYSDTEKIIPYLKQGLKIGDELKIPFSNYFDSPKDASIVLKISPEKVQELYQKNFIFKIKYIWSVVELDKETELFQKILKNPDISYEKGLEEFKSLFEKDLSDMIKNHKKAYIEKQLLENFDFEFNEEIVAYSIMGDYQFNSLEELQQKFPNYLKSTKLEILKQKIFKEYPSLSVSVKDVAQKVESDFKSLFVKPNQTQVVDENKEVEELKSISDVETDATEEYIKSITKQVMQDKNFVHNKMNQMEDDNIIQFFEEKVGTTKKTVTVKEFFETINSLI